MARRAKAVRTAVTLERGTLDAIDEIADSFEDIVSRGEIVDMAFDYILDDAARTIEAFGAEDEDAGGDEAPDEPEDEAEDHARTEEDR